MTSLVDQRKTQMTIGELIAVARECKTPHRGRLPTHGQKRSGFGTTAPISVTATTSTNPHNWRRTTMKAKRYYVQAEKAKGGRVIGYGVYDCISGMESRHAFYALADHDGNADVALHLANLHRDDLNAGVA